MSVHSVASQVLPQHLIAAIGNIFENRGTERATTTPRRTRRKAVAKVCSIDTRYARQATILLCYAQLWESGFPLKLLGNLSEKHVRVLTAKWDQDGITAATIHNRLSALRTFATWIGKPGLVKLPADYLPEDRVRRKTVAKADKSWDGPQHQLDVDRILSDAKALDERFGLYLTLQDQFGMRMKESVHFKPAKSLLDGDTFEIFEGTKGGRSRRVAIDTVEQREAFEWARRVAAENGGSLRWPSLTWRQAQARFYELAKKLGITKAALGVTAHGLRHGYAHRKYQDLAGVLPAVRGGDPKHVDVEAHRLATIATSRALGHGRLQVGSMYNGSHGHALRGNKLVPTAVAHSPYATTWFVEQNISLADAR